jgi:hypothetical protein
MSSITSPTALNAFLGALDYARQGIDRGVQQQVDAAQQIATAPVRREAPGPEAVVKLLEARQQVAAAAKVVESVDRVLGAILNVKA